MSTILLLASDQKVGRVEAIVGKRSVMVSAELSDEELMSVLARGDMRALDLLYQRYARPVFSLALRILSDSGDAEEVTQDAFERVWRHAPRYDQQRGRFASWLLSMTHHVAVDLLRKRNRRPGAVDSETAERAALSTPDESVDIVESALRNEQAERVRRALLALPESQRQAIELAYFKGLSHLEIAATLGDPLGTVKTRIKRGMERLKAALEADRQVGDWEYEH